MAVADILKDIGSGLATGAKAVGSVAQPILARTADVVSGEAPQIDAEQRRRQEALEDAAIDTKAKFLENQLAIAQKYGTLNPQQQQQYIDQITGLYSHPRHASKLMEKLRSAIHPNGAFAQESAGPLPNAVPTGGTNVADLLAKNKAALGFDQQSDEQKEQLQRKALLDDVDFMRTNIQRFMPNATPEQQQQFLNEYIERKTGVLSGKPQGMKINATGGVFTSITDPNSGRTWSASDLGPAGNAPAEAKKLYADYEAGVKGKQQEKDKEFEREQKAIQDRQAKNNENMLERMRLQFQNMLSMNNFRSANNVVQGLEKNYATSQTLESRMKQLEPKALAGDQQAMLAILANHIAMTTHQPGASMRPTKALFDEAASAQPWLQKIDKRVDQDGVLSGVVLSKDQIQQMVDLAPIMVNADLDALNQARQLMQGQLNPAPAGSTGAKRVGKILPKPGGTQTNNNAPPPAAGGFKFDAYPTS